MTSYVTGSQFELSWGRHKRFQEKISSRTSMKFRTQLEFEVSTARYNEAVRSVWTRVTGVVLMVLTWNLQKKVYLKSTYDSQFFL